MKQHLNITVTGVVQGVFFRASTQEKANALQLSGWVKNQPDGSVYIEAEGEAEKLDAFVQWCHKGPPHAVVEKCEVSEGPLQHFSGFAIMR